MQIPQIILSISSFFVRPPSWSPLSCSNLGISLSPAFPCASLCWTPCVPHLGALSYFNEGHLPVVFRERMHGKGNLRPCTSKISSPFPSYSWLIIWLDSRIQGWELFSYWILKVSLHCFSNIQCCYWEVSFLIHFLLPFHLEDSRIYSFS